MAGAAREVGNYIRRNAVRPNHSVKRTPDGAAYLKR